MMTTTIEQNVEARHAANAVVEFGIALAKDEGFEPEQVRRMWQCVREIAAELIGEKHVDPEPKLPSYLARAAGRERLRIAEEWTTTSTQHDADSLDEEPFPFGKYEGERYGDVPDSYYKWLSQQDCIEKWPDVLAYIQENGLD